MMVTQLYESEKSMLLQRHNEMASQMQQMQLSLDAVNRQLNETIQSRDSQLTKARQYCTKLKEHDKSAVEKLKKLSMRYKEDSVLYSSEKQNLEHSIESLKSQACIYIITVYCIGRQADERVTSIQA